MRTSRTLCRSSISTTLGNIWKRSGAWRLAAALRPRRPGSRRAELDDGDVDVIIAEINTLPAASDPNRHDELHKEAEYFETNKLRMCYKYFRARGFLGSGVVEAGCKTVIGHRLKQSGMRWTVAGANAIIALRCRPWQPLGRPVAFRCLTARR